jgi:2-amino-4-hydroxy-6-hydroxymethyldihydropteridine diphosphokinase
MDSAVVVALGSNLRGDYASTEALLEAAVEAFNSVDLRVLRRSRWWRSKAWPDPTDPAFLNGVCLVETRLEPRETLEALHRLEHEFGRDRHQPNAPRTLDLDLIAHGRRLATSPAVPHPRAHERRFVMGPLAEIAPDWTHPTLGRSARELAAQAEVGADAAPV